MTAALRFWLAVARSPASLAPRVMRRLLIDDSAANSSCATGVGSFRALNNNPLTYSVAYQHHTCTPSTLQLHHAP